MNNRVQFNNLTKIGNILCAIVILGLLSTTAQAQRQSAPGPLFSPNVTLNVQGSAGKCPQTVGLWWIGLPYEGGVEQTVVANTTAFAPTAQLATSNDKFVEFVSNLRSDYASCVGQARNPEYVFYNVEFKNRKAYFRVDVSKAPSSNAQIIYKTIAAYRPYVRWAIAD